MSLPGSWQNEYGSVMTLALDGHNVSGTYSSTTGSVGMYEVRGTQVGADPGERRGRPAALAVAWHSIGDDLSDPSWHCSSGLSGQINIVDGEEVLVLAHSMIAMSEFPDLAVAGSYIDKPRYGRAAGDAIAIPPSSGAQASHAPAIIDPLVGTWATEDGIEITIEVRPQARHGFGYVSGHIVFENESAAVSGFTDIKASASGLALQSVSITASDSSNGLAISLSGTLDLRPACWIYS
jgi:saccharopepsin